MGKSQDLEGKYYGVGNFFQAMGVILNCCSGPDLAGASALPVQFRSRKIFFEFVQVVVLSSFRHVS